MVVIVVVVGVVAVIAIAIIIFIAQIHGNDLVMQALRLGKGRHGLVQVGGHGRVDQQAHDGDMAMGRRQAHGGIPRVVA